MSPGPITRLDAERLTGMPGLAIRRDWCFHVDPTDRVRGPGGHLMIPCIIFANDPMRHLLDGSSPDQRRAEPWYWGGNIEAAQAICRRKNAEIGVSVDAYIDLLVSHLRPSLTRRAAPAQANGKTPDPPPAGPTPAGPTSAGPTPVAARPSMLDPALAQALAEAEILARPDDPDDHAGPSP